MMQTLLEWWTWYQAHRFDVQFVALATLTLFIGHITYGVVMSTIRDHGFPGRRLPNSNGRFRLDRSVAWMFVALTLLLLTRVWTRWPGDHDRGLSVDASTIAMIFLAIRSIMVLTAMLAERAADDVMIAARERQS